MTHIYRISLVSGLWRLMRDDRLHSTYTSQGAAKAGMATEQGRDVAATRGDIEAERPARSMDELFQCLWNKAVENRGNYDYREWEEFKSRYEALYARAYAARKGE